MLTIKKYLKKHKTLNVYCMPDFVFILFCILIYKKKTWREYNTGTIDYVVKQLKYFLECCKESGTSKKCVLCLFMIFIIKFYKQTLKFVMQLHISSF